MPVAIQQITDLRSKVHFVTGVRFEIYFALMALTTEQNGIHLPWQREAVAKLAAGNPRFIRKKVR